LFIIIIGIILFSLMNLIKKQCECECFYFYFFTFRKIVRLRFCFVRKLIVLNKRWERGHSRAGCRRQLRWKDEIALHVWWRLRVSEITGMGKGCKLIITSIIIIIEILHFYYYTDVPIYWVWNFCMVLEVENWVIYYKF